MSSPKPKDDVTVVTSYGMAASEVTIYNTTIKGCCKKPTMNNNKHACFSFLPSLSLQQFYLFLRKQLFASEVMTTAVTVLSDAQCVCVYAA